MKKLSEQEIIDEIASRRCGENVGMLKKARIRELEAKLRELVEAAEWRDECVAYATARRWLAGGNEKRSIPDVFAAAEASYQAALKAAKEGRVGHRSYILRIRKLEAKIEEAESRIQELEEILHAFLRAPSVGSDGPGSSTIVVQEYHIKAARTALKASRHRAPKHEKSGHP